MVFGYYSPDKFYFRLQLDIEVYSLLKMETPESEVPQAGGYPIVKRNFY
jgi:hypothetical protein